MEYSVTEQVLHMRLQEEINRCIMLQVELNKVAQERDHYKSELEKVSEKPAE